jgi:enoyl-CoA hydratase/carnithine racemase
MIFELYQALMEANDNENCRVVLIKGEGRAFSAGVDLKESHADDFSSDSGVIETGLKLSALMDEMRPITIAQVHGYCFTGALELVLMCDFTYCDEHTIFGDTHAKWAILPRWGMTQRLARRIGLHRAQELSFRTLRIDGVEADKIALVNHVFRDEELDERVQQVIKDIMQNDAQAIQVIKGLYKKGFSTTMGEGLKLELSADPNFADTASNLKQFDAKKTQ